MAARDDKRIGVVGLGYVGLPLAVAFAQAGCDVIAVDLDPRKIDAIQDGESYIEDVSSEALGEAAKRICPTTSYEPLSVADAVIVRVSTPEAAELTKLLENIFRSVNIALVNELAMLTDRMGIDIWEVVDAASTKPYGLMRFDPGPGMGGHCLPVDPFYLSWRAREFDMSTELIELAGKVNQQMPYHCAARAARALNDAGLAVNGARISVFGVSYKPGVRPALRPPGAAGSLLGSQLLQRAALAREGQWRHLTRCSPWRQGRRRSASSGASGATAAQRPGSAERAAGVRAYTVEAERPWRMLLLCASTSILGAFHRGPIGALSFRRGGSMPTLAGFVDHGYLRAEGARALKLDRRQTRTDAAEVVRWIKCCAAPSPLSKPVPGGLGARFLRAYWYDGAFDPADPRRASQEQFLAAIAAQEGIQLRLGHIQEVKPAWQHALRRALRSTGVDERTFAEHFTLRPELRQKGVDTRITLDLVRLAQRRAFDAAVLIAGDRDLAEAVRVAQDEGVLITVASPSLNTVARELRELADHLIEIPAEELGRMLQDRDPGRPQER